VPSPDLASPADAATAQDGASGGMAFRPDVEGLRAVAIAAVVGYHVGLPFMSGGFVGVDVFFVISGFLITGLLVAEATATGHVSLARFWARRARRLLPAATLVLAVVAVASYLLIPALDHTNVGLDIVASALYLSNMRFAAQATDYLGADAAPSPVLHFWSLGVEEQFYVVWPLLILALLVLVGRRHGITRRHLAIALAVLGTASFVLSLRLTEQVEPWAFFGMPTRAWEFAIGGLLAIGGTVIARVDARVRHAIGLVGALVLVASIVLLTNDVPYPGTAALWPVLATAAVIAVGGATSRRAVGVPGLLSTPPMRWLGRHSYSWYLWHWPVLVLAASAWGPLSVPVRGALALLALGPAVIAYRRIEQPLHHSAALVASTRRSLQLGAALSLGAAVFGLVLALLPGGGALASGLSAPGAADEQTGRGQAGAAPTRWPTPQSSAGHVIASPWPDGPLTPAPSRARADLPIIYNDGCHLDHAPTTSPPCVFGDAASSTTVVLLGDSHAAQWFPALALLADKHHWRLVVRTKAGCPAPDVTILNRSLKRPYAECDTWRSQVLADLAAMKPMLVVASGTRTDSLVDRSTGSKIDAGLAGGEWKAGWNRTLARLSASGVPVAVLRDTPWPGSDVAVCVSRHTTDPSACDVSRTALDSPAYDVALAAAHVGAHGVDLSDVICDPDRCPATQGRYLVYRDSNHLTATFAKALAPYLYRQLAPLLEQKP
jgi:peptidoglycan/LPS O-acetylase OafA/YrhL